MTSDSGSSEIAQIARSVDLTGEVCPMTFFKTKLILDRLGSGEVLEVILKGDEQMRNVPRGVKEEGHRIIQVTPDGDLYHVLIRKSA